MLLLYASLLLLMEEIMYQLQLLQDVHQMGLIFRYRNGNVCISPPPFSPRCQAHFHQGTQCNLAALRKDATVDGLIHPIAPTYAQL